VTRFQRWFLYWSSAAAFVSGVAYFWMKHFLDPAEPWAVINHPLQPWALKAHILTAPLMLFAVGMITTRHIWRSLRSKLPTGRRTGVVAAFSFGPLVLTGYLMQTATATMVADLLGWTHLALGIGCTAAIALHPLFVRGRRRRRPGSLPVLVLPMNSPAVDGADGGSRSSRAEGGAVAHSERS